MLLKLSEKQVTWTLNQIYEEKETTYTGTDYGEIKECWDPKRFDMDPEDLAFLKEMYDVLTAEENDLETITG